MSNDPYMCYILVQDIRRELKIDPFVQLTTVAMGAEQPQQKKVVSDFY